MTAQLALFPATPTTTAPVCLVTGRPMQRGKHGWICGVACQPGWDADKVGAPYVHGKCWHAAKGATT